MVALLPGKINSRITRGNTIQQTYAGVWKPAIPVHDSIKNGIFATPNEYSCNW